MLHCLGHRDSCRGTRPDPLTCFVLGVCVRLRAPACRPDVCGFDGPYMAPKAVKRIVPQLGSLQHLLHESSMCRDMTWEVAPQPHLVTVPSSEQNNGVPRSSPHRDPLCGVRKPFTRTRPCSSRIPAGLAWRSASTEAAQ